MAVYDLLGTLAQFRNQQNNAANQAGQLALENKRLVADVGLNRAQLAEKANEFQKQFGLSQQEALQRAREFSDNLAFQRETEFGRQGLQSADLAQRATQFQQQLGLSQQEAMQRAQQEAAQLALSRETELGNKATGTLGRQGLAQQELNQTTQHTNLLDFLAASKQFGNSPLLSSIFPQFSSLAGLQLLNAPTGVQTANTLKVPKGRISYPSGDTSSWLNVDPSRFT